MCIRDRCCALCLCNCGFHFILHYVPKSRKLNTAEQFEIYRYHTLQPNNILNEQLHYRSHILFNTPVSYTHLDVYKRQEIYCTVL